jgi:hypothetical protein
MQWSPLIVCLALLTSACASNDSADLASVQATSTPAPSTATGAPAPKQASAESFDAIGAAGSGLRAFNGRQIPETVGNATDAAALFISVETALRVDNEPPETYADLGHTEQVLIRSIMRHPEWHEDFRRALPDDLLIIADLHMTARSELGLLHTGGGPPIDNIPAWEIIEPEELDALIGHYKSAGEETGIDWRVLAGINLIETGMGRIDGLSSAGAQGPMQFLPSTWDEVSEGGDVNNPQDAVHGAARYLVRRGGLDDIADGLWGYNNSDHYVNAVLAYVELLTLDERALRGFYNWEIYVGTEAGTLWLPVGYRSEDPLSAATYVAENPWARTLN